ncbi:MAG TPA: hypothetical protein VGE59_05005, partial [Patescibacteria group bacterium]
MNSFEEIYLETDEEVTSAIDKIKKSKKKNVALCLPRHAVMGQSIVNLKLLYKEAIASGKKLALVSSDKITRALAEKVGFFTFEQASDIVFDKDEIEEAPEPKKQLKEAEEVSITRERFPVSEKEPQEEVSEQPAPATPTVKGFTKQTVTDIPEEELKESEQSPLDDKTESSPEVKSSRPKSSMIPTKGNLRFYRQSKRPAFLIPLLIAVAVVVIGGVSAVLAIPRATVDITVSAQPFNETVNSNVDIETTAVDVTKSTIPGKLVSVEYETKSSAKATGKKDTGEKATGTVLLINEWDSLNHTFEAGTKLRAKNGNEFVLTEDVVLPGASSTLSGGKTVITSGKKEANVVAAAAGPNYNNAAT